MAAHAQPHAELTDPDALERQDWLESLEDVLQRAGPERVRELLGDLQIHAQRAGVTLPSSCRTPYVNTIPPHREAPFPGNREIERRIKSIVRWNAMAMVVRANKYSAGIGGHISTYASCATLYEVGHNHFFRGRDHPSGGDFVYFQGHATAGNYARAYLEGRLSETAIGNFRRELQSEPGVSSYPHPWLMPDFWEYPTVSMGIGPIMAIYRARFMKYLENRGLKRPTGQRVWCFLGDGECDEPETLAALSIAAREQLDNLIFVVNCNLQRLDGPVRGNSQIVQELEGQFRGAGWNVIKLLWGSDWDPLFARDPQGKLAKRLGEMVDGAYQKLRVEGGAYIRSHVFGVDPDLEALVSDMSDEQLWKLRLGGHDPEKVYAGYHAAVRHQGGPTVVLAQTIKGYGLGEAGEGKNITHQQKKLNEQELVEFRDRFEIPIPDDKVAKAPFYKPPDDSVEMQYLHERRRALGGYPPERRRLAGPIDPPDWQSFDEFKQGTQGREASTTMAFVRILSKMLKDKNIGKRIVPIVPDEARTFGMDALFRQCGIYSAVGQLYEPVDASQLMYYKEAKDGQLLEEGITEAGSISSFIAAGTAHTNHGLQMIPVFTYYSMFGFQRIGDLIWAAGDSRARGFMLGGTAGRTSLAGEGLQHQDGQSHHLAHSVPNVVAYDPAYAYEIAVIVEEGIRRMFLEEEDVIYYLTMTNDNYAHPPMPEGEGVREGILKGMYRYRRSDRKKPTARAQLLGSGPILNEVLKAQQMLAEQYGVAADVWSVTSYNELRRDAMEAERWNVRHPEAERRVPYVTQCLQDAEGVVVAASDYLRSLPDSVAKWVPSPLISLGTDGFGRSEARAELRDFFEVDARHVVFATLSELARHCQVDKRALRQAQKDLSIDPDKPEPVRS